ncbi:MAG: CxxC-x17-CxxC domain-containing protein [Candidatus Paceibacterota bacterium]|jgi:CxxC-x17-CxxC domain-containing protein
MAFNKIFDHERRGSGSRERDFKRRDSGGNRGFGNRDRGDRERPEMYEAICSDCGKRCEVPFKPTGEKPVYCSSCFTNHGGASRSDSRSDRGDRERPRHSDRPMFDAVCNTCGKRFELPFRPTGEKPVYCSECFEKEGGNSSVVRSTNVPVNQYKEQFEMLNSKLDKILKVLTQTIPAKEEKKEIVIEKKPVVAEVKKEVIVAKKPIVVVKKVQIKKPAKIVVKKAVTKKKGKK